MFGKTVFYFSGKAEFSTSLLETFRNHSNMMISSSRNISYYYQCWKPLCCFIFLWKPWYISSGFCES